MDANHVHLGLIGLALTLSNIDPRHDATSDGKISFRLDTCLAD